MESFSFHLKCWLKLTYPVVACCHDLGWSQRMPTVPGYINRNTAQCCLMTSCLKYSDDNCTVNFSDVGTAQCTLHLHGLFALLVKQLLSINCASCGTVS